MKQPTARQIKIIINMFLPKGWKLRQRKCLDGWACPIQRAIKVPTIKDKTTLGIFLHECAHFHLRHVRLTHGYANPPGCGGKWHIIEYLAERFSCLALTWLGFPPTKAYVNDCKAYVKSWIKIERKLKHPIDPVVEAWVNQKGVV